jgi:hypothetical protein
MKSIRITKLPNDTFIVEEQISKWTIFGIKNKWVPLVKTTGLDECWQHGNIEFAVRNAVAEIKSRIFFNEN